MADAVMPTLAGRRILVVEDEYVLAADVAQALEELGAVVVGPAATAERALALVAGEDRLDGAVLDIDLGGERAYSVADALVARGVPFVFATGYDHWVVPAAHAQAPRCEKPVDTTVLTRTLSARIDRGSA
jgi:CheY-like chemotaxis protein